MIFSKVATAISLVLVFAVRPISLLFPRNKTIWLFIGWQKSANREVFSDNCKYLFLEVTQKHQNIQAIWLCQDQALVTELRDHGYKAVYRYSLQGIGYQLRAGVVILSAIMQNQTWALSGGARIIQLWHGDGIKNMKMPTTTDPFGKEKIKNLLLNPGIYANSDLYISSSEFTAANFIAPSFAVSLDKVHITGLPRYDALEDDILGSEIDIDVNLKQYIETVRQNSNRIILYAPTFRRGQDRSRSLDQLHLVELNNFLRERNYHFIISLHPKFSQTDLGDRNQYSNIYLASPGWDKYPLLRYIDLLVTDYSSTFFEFLYLNKPTIFYAYDFQEYAEKQGLHKEIWESLPGEKVYEYKDLLRCLQLPTEQLIRNNEKYREKIFSYRDGSASARIAQRILEL